MNKCDVNIAERKNILYTCLHEFEILKKKHVIKINIITLKYVDVSIFIFTLDCISILIPFNLHIIKTFFKLLI